MRTVSVKDVRKEYRLGATAVSALKGVSLEVARGEFLAIAGPSGSGKSTLLNLIGCIERPTSGQIEIEGTDIGPLSQGSRAELRARRLGFVFQTFNLLPVLTVAENVEYPLLISSVGRVERVERVRKALSEVGLERFSRHKPGELSGGQRQRVAIARALVGSPAIILADEPTANLDHKTGTEVLHLMKEINTGSGTTFIFSTHDSKIMSMADRVVELRDGEVAGD
ncbi:MAG TPA: ABC transporter ATP-binding protein [Thermodesulfobacteriota bacterium]